MNRRTDLVIYRLATIQNITLLIFGGNLVTTQISIIPKIGPIIGVSSKATTLQLNPVG